MKRTFFLTAALSLICLLCEAQSRQALILQMAAGDRIVYALDSEPSISFSGQTMQISFADAPTEQWSMDNVLRWEIGTTDAAGISDPAQDVVNISIDNGIVNIAALHDCEVSAFTIDGLCVFSDCTRQTSIDLPRGLYIINVGDKTYKIFVR